MKAIKSRMIVGAAAALAMTAALLSSAAANATPAHTTGYDSNDPAQKAQYDQALDLGTQAYVYGVALLDMDRIFRANTSVDICDDAYNGPVNQLCPQRTLADPENHTIVAPNFDTLYQLGWLDLRKQPLVLHVPNSGGRLNVVPLLSPYEENFAAVGSGASGIRAPGDYTITGPDDHGGKVPAGTTEIRSPYNRVWVVQRTYVNNGDPTDLAQAHAIQDATTITPLNKWGKGKYVAPLPKHPDTIVDVTTIPGTQPGGNPLAFFDALNQQLGEFAPVADDRPLIDQLATVGIRPGGVPLTDNDELSAATLAGLSDAVAAGKATVNKRLTQEFTNGFAAHNGYLVEPTGNYGTDYGFRAVVDQIAVGALPKNVAIYPAAQTDRTGALLDGTTKRYIVHLNGPNDPTMPQLPIPANAFWSLTMYDFAAFLVPNPLNRFVINDRSDLHYNDDGSLDLYVQRDAPTDPEQLKNWLPAPASNFRLAWRLYGPPADKIDGIIDGSAWKPGTILPCTATGFTSAFPPAGVNAPIACAQ